ncbi:PSP1 C-terminal conserved region-domain-containing protein [Crassisporium funariophilum]|nr:PSP1 C-terminal conserved region-domain-containing protein [Crassisporium funariophilum]
MERSVSGHEQNVLDDDDRRSRFQNTTGTENGSASLRERAASQPPRSSDNNNSFVSSPPTQHFIPSSISGNWSNSRMLSPNRGQPVPIRSSSFSAHPQGQFSSMQRTFPSTFEEDETESLSDTYDERFIPSSLLNRGRSYGQDPSRSRSQSLATATTTRPGPVGSPYLGTSAMQSWNESYLSHTTPQNIPQRYGEIKPPGSSRYGSLGTLGRSPTNIHSSSPTGAFVGNGFGRNQQADISNMSPFVRDVGQILLDDGSAFRELWAGMNPPRDENGGGGSGTTSRRHSVSVVQPRRGNVVGFNAPGNDGVEEPSRSTFQPAYGRSGLLLSDDDLAVDLGMLNINSNEHAPSSSTQHPPSQPSSLPIYAPLSRSPPSRDLMSTYQSINLTIPGGNNYSRQSIGTPSDGDFSAGGNSPPRQGLYEQHLAEAHYNSGRGNQQQQPELTARYIPGQGIQYLPPQQQSGGHQGAHAGGNPQYVRNRAPSYSSTNSMTSPISPTGTRAINPQQQPYYPQTQRRLSDAQHHQQPPTPQSQHGPGPHHQNSLADLGKGVPLHAVPSSWPLFIVEFKAGRTDLFYLTDLGQDIRVGDLVIVEADRGKDLGKVVNDSITLAEVEAFQKQQAERGFGGSNGEPTSPGGSGGSGPGAGKKEINPKMIYGKAGQQDMQLLATKTQDELKALQLCQSKVRAKKLPMEVIDAEYQWDRRKLTFYFVAEKRIDFRELVRELFRLYKTRIWMASLQGGGGFEQ